MFDHPVHFCFYNCAVVAEKLTQHKPQQVVHYWLGVGEKIDPSMHRDSLSNDSGSIRRISESILTLSF